MFSWDDILIIGDSYAFERTESCHWPQRLTLQLTGTAFDKNRIPRGFGFRGCSWWSVRNELLRELKIHIPKVLVLCHTDDARLWSDSDIGYGMTSTAAGSEPCLNRWALGDPFYHPDYKLACQLYYKHLFSPEFHYWTQQHWFLELDGILSIHQIPFVLHIHNFQNFILDCYPGGDPMGRDIEHYLFKQGITGRELLVNYTKLTPAPSGNNHMSDEENILFADALYNTINNMKPFETGRKDFW